MDLIFPEPPPRQETLQQELHRRHCRLLTPQEKERYLGLLGKGYAHDQAVKKMKVSSTSITVTRERDSDFSNKVKDIRSRQVKEIENLLLKMGFGRTKAIKNTYSTVVNSDGDLLTDGYRKPILVLKKREETISPPNLDAILSFLRANEPDGKYCYNRNKEMATPQFQTQDDLIKALKDRLADLKLDLPQ